MMYNPIRSTTLLLFAYRSGHGAPFPERGSTDLGRGGERGGALAPAAPPTAPYVLEDDRREEIKAKQNPVPGWLVHRLAQAQDGPSAFNLKSVPFSDGYSLKH